MGQKQSDSQLDEIDKEILRLLQADGSLTTPLLAEKVSLSVTPCWRRLKRLEEAGYIRDYQANLDRRKIGLGIFAFVQITFGNVGNPEPIEAFEEAVQKIPEILSCHKITGSADYMLQVVVENLDAYGDFVENVLRHLPGVSLIHSGLSIREIKSTSRLPL
ncbi:Lrp/AsnC family transcriptional regulator [Leeia sp. TBRC 13508]|uniref:Lrp/AsnC family transcriptional regulator n=1 Tax=Leeia speluncae TaxID=2884804 RepID=A0ABS8D7M7_9NEIS|nr:Lrp/AsnC family transcriptional regulator [Leeia speluncae]MCB6184048.1 Lrp/AsnC family transcriptional regulator [Leeia speluncae]